MSGQEIQSVRNKNLRKLCWLDYRQNWMNSINQGFCGLEGKVCTNYWTLHNSVGLTGFKEKWFFGKKEILKDVKYFLRSIAKKKLWAFA